ncbi:MAG: hypothetical protein ABEJ82_10050 [Haloplanus sp.]
MDRISALRNVEETLREFESGAVDLAETERRVLAVLRTYATEFDDESGRAAYAGRGDEAAEGVVVVAESRAAARERIADLADGDPTFEVERLG